MKLCSWNVNGIRAAHKKGFLEWLSGASADVVSIQETKAHPDQLEADLVRPPGYHAFWAPAVRKGYSGVALFTRPEPDTVHVGLGIEEFDREGRTIITEYSNIVLISAYFPNGSRDHSRVPFKLAYCEAFLERCNRYRDAGRSIVFCGDVNTAHREIDLARPKQNQNTTGFLPEERAWIDRVLEAGYIDTFRALFPDTAGAYSWWAYWGGARERNVGWRLDYFFVSPDLAPHIQAARIHAEVMGSDHCPVSVELSI
jgi:exodeoxyribonuclease-3